MTLSPSDSADGSAETTTLTESDRIRLLASSRRRAILEVVEDRSMPVDLDTLARAVGVAEIGVDGLTEETVDRIAITLHHDHLPRLDDAGVLDYDAASNAVVAVRNLPID